jgi:hypothetical protein
LVVWFDGIIVWGFGELIVLGAEFGSIVLASSFNPMGLDCHSKTIEEVLGVVQTSEWKNTFRVC